MKPLFSAARDTVNQGNIKLDLLAVEFFTLECAIENKMLDFYENHNETASAIIEQSKEDIGSWLQHQKNVCLDYRSQEHQL